MNYVMSRRDLGLICPVSSCSVFFSMVAVCVRTSVGVGACNYGYASAWTVTSSLHQIV